MHNLLVTLLIIISTLKYSQFMQSNQKLNAQRKSRLFKTQTTKHQHAEVMMNAHQSMTYIQFEPYKQNIDIRMAYRTTLQHPIQIPDLRPVNIQTLNIMKDGDNDQQPGRQVSHLNQRCSCSTSLPCVVVRGVWDAIKQLGQVVISICSSNFE